MPGDMFVGREPELRALEQFLGKAAAAKTQIVFVAGEAGAGKSALVTEFVRRTEQADPNVVAAIGECNAQTGAGDAYLPFRQVLTILSGAQDEKETSKAIDATNASRLRELMRVSSETLLDIAPDLVGIFVPGAALLARLATSAASNTMLGRQLADRMRQSDGGATGPRLNSNLDQEKIFQQYTNVVQALARERTLILILDDLQWADSASLNLLFHLARQLKESRVLLLGTYRPDDVALGRGGERHPLEPILNELKRYNGDIVIDLGAAQATESRAFVDALVDSEPNRLDVTFRNELFAQTEGHPLFTIELLRTLQERGDVVQDAEGKWIQSATLNWEALPARVEGVIEERIARLEGNLRETLNIGSVIGYEFAAQVVARVQQVQERELLRNLTRELEKRHRLVLEEGETQVGRQFLSQYRFIHALFQQFLYNELGTGERRMMHGEVADALEQLYAEHSDAIAVQLARHYLEAGEDEKTVEYATRAGDQAAVLYAYAAARGFYAQALTALSRLTETAENQRRRVDTILKQVQVSVKAIDPTQNLAQLAEAESIVQQLSQSVGATSADRVRLARIHFWMGQEHFLRNELREALEYFQQVLAVTQGESGDKELEANTLGTMGRMLAFQGQFGQAVPFLDRAVALLEAAGNRSNWIIDVGNLGLSLAARGEFAAGLARGQHVLARAEEAKDPRGIGWSQISLAQIYWHGGAMPRVVEASRAGMQAAEQVGDRVTVFVGAIFAGWAESRLAQPAAAAAHLTQAKSLAQQLGGQLAMTDRLAVAEAELALNMGHIQEALMLAEQAVAQAQAIGSIYSEGMAQRVWGQALARLEPARWKEAEEHLEAGLSAFEAGEARLEAAHTHVAWGKVLQARGDNDAARQHFEQAAAQFEASGLAQQLDETRGLITTLK
jgi:tetratricopeptide (TPR) repeat protein